MTSQKQTLSDALNSQIKRLNQRKDMSRADKEAIISEFGFRRLTPQEYRRTVEMKIDEAYNNLMKNTSNQKERQVKKKELKNWLYVKYMYEQNTPERELFKRH